MKIPKTHRGPAPHKMPLGATCGPRVWDLWSTWLWIYMRTETNICSMQNFLRGTLLVTDFTNLCKHIDKWYKL